MTMSAGFPEDESTPSLISDAIRQDGDAVAFILKHGLVSPPGETFAYSNSSAHLVSAVLAEALRRSDGSNPRTVLDYATQKLFKPLGIDTRNAYTARFRPDNPTPFEKAGFGWAADAQGINIGAGQLRLRPADMLKVGQLYLDGGRSGRRPACGALLSKPATFVLAVVPDPDLGLQEDLGAVQARGVHPSPTCRSLP